MRGSVESMPGVLKVVRDGSFLAVIAEREYQADQGDARAGGKPRAGTSSRTCPIRPTIYDYLQAAAGARHDRSLNRGTTATGGSRHRRRPITGPTRCTARSARPARSRAMRRRQLTVWTHSQGVFPLRARARRAGRRCRPTKVRCIHVEGSGCYGHNGADDAGGRRGADGARGAGPAGARAMDARAGARLGALRPGDG